MNCSFLVDGMRDRTSMSTDRENIERASSLGMEARDDFEESGRGRFGSERSGGEGVGASNGLRERFREKGRSKSTSRTDDKRRRSRSYFDSASASLTSIPNRIQLSMLKSGLMTISELLNLFII